MGQAAICNIFAILDKFGPVLLTRIRLGGGRRSKAAGAKAETVEENVDATKATESIESEEAVEIEATEDVALDEEAPAEGKEENMDDTPSNNGVNGDGEDSKPEAEQKEDSDNKEDKSKEDELILDGDDDEFTVVDEVSGDAPKEGEKDKKEPEKKPERKSSESPEERKLRKESHGLLATRRRYEFEENQTVASKLILMEKISLEDLMSEGLAEAISCVSSLAIKVRRAEERNGYLEMTFPSVIETREMADKLRAAFEPEPDRIIFSDPTIGKISDKILQHIKHKSGKDPNCAVMLYGVPEELTAEQILEWCPKAKSFTMSYDWKTETNRRFGFLEFDKSKDAHDFGLKRFSTVKVFKPKTPEELQAEQEEKERAEKEKAEREQREKEEKERKEREKKEQAEKEQREKEEKEKKEKEAKESEKKDESAEKKDDEEPKE